MLNQVKSIRPGGAVGLLILFLESFGKHIDMLLKLYNNLEFKEFALVKICSDLSTFIKNFAQNILI